MTTRPDRAGDLVGYARVSTWDQNDDMQLDSLREAGCARVFSDHASGTRTDRPQLAAALDYVRPGDTLMVWRLDRLGRSLRHLIETVAALEGRGVHFKSIHESIDTTTSTGRLVFHIFAALAEFERDLIVDRTMSGLAAARERGAKPGRKPSLSVVQVAAIRRMDAEGTAVTEIASAFSVSRATVYRALQAPAPADDTPDAGCVTPAEPASAPARLADRDRDQCIGCTRVYREGVPGAKGFQSRGEDVICPWCIKRERRGELASSEVDSGQVGARRG